MNSKKKEKKVDKELWMQYPFAYPVEFLILSCYMLTKWFLATLFKTIGTEYSHEVKVMKASKIVKLQRCKKPPDKENEAVTDEKNKITKLGLLAAINVMTKTPRFNTTQGRNNVMKLRKYRNQRGYLKVDAIPNTELMELRNLMEITSNTPLIKDKGMFEVIVDSGCTNSTTSCKEDFVPGTMTKLDEPIQIEGVGGDIQVEHYGILNWEYISNAGKVVKLHHVGHYAPNLGTTRLLSPQRCFEQADNDGKFIVKNRRCYIKTGSGEVIEANLNKETGLPTLMAFHNVEKTSIKLAKLHTILAPDNGNLTGLQKEMLKWHYKLGHVGFQNLQWIGREGILGAIGKQFGTTKCHPPKCEACQMGKQARKHAQGTTIKRKNEGILYKDKTKPGDLVFSDQYVCSQDGRYYNPQGRMNTQQTYKGGTVFFDAASKYIHVTNQVGFGAYETINAKLEFKKEAQGVGIEVKKYCTDNGVYTSREFQGNLNEKGQGIQYCGVGAHHQNGPAENAIKILMNKARTMMFHSALCWPEHTKMCLWPLAVKHAAYLHNNIPNMATGLAPIEVWSSSKSNHTSIINAQPWGCPAYVLEPSLQDGHKIPKWQPRSRRGQYLGVSARHASTVGVIRNLRTNNISPQYHVIYDSYFETVHSTQEEPPQIWDQLVVFNRSLANFDEKQNLPELSDEWMDPEECKDHEETSKQKKELDRKEDEVQWSDQPRDEDASEKEPEMSIKKDNDDNRKIQRDNGDREESQEASPDDNAPPLRRSTRIRKPPTRFAFNKEHGYNTIKTYVAKINRNLNVFNGQAYDLQHLLALVLDPEYGIYDNVPMHMYTNTPHILKASATRDPDTPNIREALGGEYFQEFQEAMKKEIQELEEHGTWTVQRKDSIPEGANVVPSTWAFKIKRTPAGDIKKFKARFCVRGDKQIEGVDYFETYAPVVSWASIRMLLCCTLQYGWYTRQVDFSNAFVHATLKEDVYITLPAMFQDNSGEDSRELVLKLEKSLYGLAQSPRTWYYCLKETLEELGFVRCEVEPGVFFGNGMTVVCWVDDCLFFGPNEDKIDEVIEGIEGKGFKLTKEDTKSDVFTFLGVELAKQDGKIVLSQENLIKKVLESTNMMDCNPKSTPCTKDTLGTNAEGAKFKEKWEYASIVGMMMYLCNNAYPEIQFAVHQCARFTHCPRQSHAEAIKRICRYLKKILKDNEEKGYKHGLTFRRDTRFRLECFVDADFAGLWKQEDDQDPISVKSRTGYVMMMNGNPVHWVSKLQGLISVSTTEAEYIALSQAMRELLPMREFLSTLQQKMELEGEEPIMIRSTIFEDNNGAITVATAPKMTPRTKHIAVKYHFFKQFIGDEQGINIKKVDTSDQIADIFTKGLEEKKFDKLRHLLCGW